MLAGVVPAHVLTAAVALTKRPGMGGKPGVLKRRHARGATSKRLGERDDFKANSFRIGVRELFLALILETIPVIKASVSVRVGRFKKRAQKVCKCPAIRFGNLVLPCGHSCARYPIAQNLQDVIEVWLLQFEVRRLRNQGGGGGTFSVA